VANHQRLLGPDVCWGYDESDGSVGVAGDGVVAEFVDVGVLDLAGAVVPEW
jgi:hypothetical protein